MTSWVLLQDYITNISTLAANTQYYRERYISQFLHFLQDYDIDLLAAGRKEFALYATIKLQLGCKRSTIKLYLLYILYFYRYLTEETIYSEEKLNLITKYFSKFKVPKGEKKTALSPDQVDRLFFAVSTKPTLKIATWMVLNFGFRLSELIRLNVEDVDLDNDEIQVLESKGLKTRRIPILDYQKPILKQWLQLRKNFLPLGSTDNAFLISKLTEKRPSGKWLQQNYRRLSKKFGFRIYAHRLRRTYASILYFDNDVELWIISWLLGHANIQTTMIYLGISEDLKISKFRSSMKNKIIIKI